jgi:spermidine/putrescine transport system permease protein
MNDSRSLWHFPGMRAAAALVLAYLYIPIIVLVVLSFSDSDAPLANWQGFSLRWYGVMAGDADMMRALWNSSVVATVATVCGTVVALAAALATSTERFKGQAVVETVIGLPLIIPDIVAAISILLFFVMIDVPLGLPSLFLAHIMFSVPIAYLPIRARLQGLDRSYAEAAADLYASPWRSFRHITLPLIWPGIVSGAMLAFVGSLGDVVISYFISGPGATTLPVYVFSMVRMGVTPSVNAVSTVVISVSVVLVTLSYLLERFSGQNRRSADA